MKKAILVALALSTASAAAVPALAQDRDRDRHDQQVVVREGGWTPTIVVRRGHHGYWDERHHWREARFVHHGGHHGYWDHHHQWHDWNG